MKRWGRRAAAVACFGASMLFAALLTGGCDLCELELSHCEEVRVDDGVYRFAEGSSPSWALEVGELVVAEATLTIGWTDFDGVEREAVWSVEPLR